MTPSPPSSSAAAQSSLENEEFGRLLDLEPAALVALGSRVLRDVLHHASSSSFDARLVETFAGSFNLVHVLELDADQKMVLRVPITGKAGTLSGAARQALGSQVCTMRHIRATTTLPVPEVYHFDTTDENEISAPYVAMSFIPGTTVAKIWFEDQDGEGEKRRLRILSQLAGFAAQLRELRFPSIGSLVPGSDSTTSSIGPCFDWVEPTGDEDADNVEVTSYGPFATTESWLRHLRALTKETGNRFSTRCSPASQSTPRTKTMPDFDSQNVMVDEHGTITGLVDWDHAQTLPDFLGFARYPGWITRDWDPLMYGWPVIQDTENSPEELEKYRRFYVGEMKAALATTGSGDHRLTEKAHVFEALFIAVSNRSNATSICEKFVREAIRVLPEGDTVDGLDQEALGVLLDIGDGELDKDAWLELQKGLRMLMVLSE
ncbi:hypothetical protein GGX14DRAFT_390109 [Mycena pura]|uniref:Aminoglycoside phosphotransferase domain-containing protein n=1 Tax=Mycena pura TaxID=153505 RepID=A0AAD6VQ93_9AGAR|nr:hypothetical protein GGX14DRAFT_390109 [Mycena pura]